VGLEGTLALAMTKLRWDPLNVLSERTSGVAQLLQGDALYQTYVRASQTPLGQTHHLANWVPGLFALAWTAIAVLAVARHLGVLPSITRGLAGT
jgi:hypothetical protein